MGNSPSINFYRADVPYQLVDGTQVAANYAGLTAAPGMNLDNNINLDETGTLLPNSSTWTGTLGDGSSTGNNCNNWTDATDQFSVTLGSTVINDLRWTVTSLSANLCFDSIFHLFCIEQ